MKKAENEKSTVLQGYREGMPEAESILILSEAGKCIRELAVRRSGGHGQ